MRVPSHPGAVLPPVPDPNQTGSSHHTSTTRVSSSRRGFHGAAGVAWKSAWHRFRSERRERERQVAAHYAARLCHECGFPRATGEHAADCRREFRPAQVIPMGQRAEEAGIGGIDETRF